MRKKLIILFWFAACLQLCRWNVAAQPSVYSGVFVYNSGGLDTLAKQQTITNFVSDAQKDVSIINLFKSWATSGTTANSPFPTTAMNYVRSHGAIPLLSWEPWNPSSGVSQPAFSLSNITAGVHDAYITTWATTAKNWGHPFFLRPAHEMNGNWYPWCSGVNSNTSAQYVQMWRHVHDLFESVGATNVTWVWCVNFLTSTPINQLYPGDNYVDWISVDGYNRLANSWQDFSALAAPTVTQLTNIAPGKPIMVAETGCNQNPSFNKSQWFLNVLTNYLPSVQPRIKAWVYFNSTNTSDGNEWRITIPASAVPGYQQGIGLSYYASNQYGTISSSPIQPLLNDTQVTDTMPPFVSIVSPAAVVVTNSTTVNVRVLASDKSGINKVVFSVNGSPQQTNNSPPYQFAWNVPAAGGVNYIVTATAYDNAGNSAVSTIQVVSSGVAATNIRQTINQQSANQPVSPGDWTVAIWGTPAAVAVNSNNYQTTNSLYVRTPNSVTPAAFAGGSLQIDPGGTLYLKNGGQTSGNAATVNLLLNGGAITFHGGFASNGPAVAGTLQLLNASTINTDQTGGNSADIWLQSTLSGSGNLTVNMNSTTNSVLLSGNNSAFTGNWTNASTFGRIKIISGTTNALGSGSVALVNAGAELIFNSTNNLIVNNVISGLGSVQQVNTNTVTLNSGNTFTGPLVISNGVLKLGSNGSIAGTPSIQLFNLAALDVAAVSGGFAVSVAQTLSGVGSVFGNVTVNGTASPGRPLGTLNFSNSLTLSGTVLMELNRASNPNTDLISATTLTYGGTLTVTNLGGALQLGDSFKLFSGTISGAFVATNLPPITATNFYWDTSKLNSQGIIAVALKTAATPTILSPAWDGTNLTFQVDSQAGYDYMLQATPQLWPASWTPVVTNAGGGLMTFAVPTSATQQFFRIMAW